MTCARHPTDALNVEDERQRLDYSFEHMRDIVLKLQIFPLLFVALMNLLVATHASAQTTQASRLVVDRDGVKSLMKRVMKFQVKAYADNPKVNWQAGAFWAGVMAADQATGDAAFHDAAKAWGEAVGWRLNVGSYTLHSDSIAVGQAYLDLFAKDQKGEMIGALKPQMEKFLNVKTVGPQDVGKASHVLNDSPYIGRNVWWWCDALFMAPPTFAKMSQVTGDQRWLDLMHLLYWDAVDFLYDPDEKLFYRDATFFFDRRKTPSGKKVFWSRGNGWVYAGIIRTLDAMPKDDSHRQKYVDLFKQMTTAVVKCQGEDGMWRPCMNDPEWFTTPESSGTGFFCYGLLAGINRGYLDRETYLPKALHAWEGLTSHLDGDGLLGYAQREGAGPARTSEYTFRDFANGAFLLAGSELYKLNLTAKDVSSLKERN
jgi:rhamnogalacturonyl hydrolase YesR